MVIIAACSSSAHQLLDLLSDRYVFLPYRAASSVADAVLADTVLADTVLADAVPARYSASGARLSDPATRSARGNTRRLRASSKHAGLRCRYAPRPGSRACGSGRMSSPTATKRSRLDLTARSLQPTHVRVGSCCSARTVIPTISLPRSAPRRAGRPRRVRDRSPAARPSWSPGPRLRCCLSARPGRRRRGWRRI
jgi:hypothetical protein